MRKMAIIFDIPGHKQSALSYENIKNNSIIFREELKNFKHSSNTPGFFLIFLLKLDESFGIFIV